MNIAENTTFHYVFQHNAFSQVYDTRKYSYIKKQQLNLNSILLSTSNLTLYFHNV